MLLAVGGGGVGRGVDVVGWGQDHGGLVCLRVLVVEVDHTLTPQGGIAHAGERKKRGRVGVNGLYTDINKSHLTS